MKTPPPPTGPARFPWLLLRQASCLVTGVFFLTSSGCPLKNREQDGDVDIDTAVYDVTVTPRIVNLTPASLDTVLELPFTVSGQCGGIFDATECAAFQPGWTATPGFNVPGVTISIASPDAQTSTGTIRITNLRAFFDNTPLPSEVMGNIQTLVVYLQPSRALPRGVRRQRGSCTVLVTPPGSATREETTADSPALAAPGDLTLKPATGQTTLSLEFPVTYTGPPTRTLPGEILNDPAGVFTAVVIPENIGGDNSSSITGTAIFTLPPSGAFLYTATLKVGTENGATRLIALKGMRP